MDNSDSDSDSDSDFYPDFLYDVVINIKSKGDLFKNLHVDDLVHFLDNLDYTTPPECSSFHTFTFKHHDDILDLWNMISSEHNIYLGSFVQFSAFCFFSSSPKD